MRDYDNEISTKTIGLLLIMSGLFIYLLACIPKPVDQYKTNKSGVYGVKCIDNHLYNMVYMNGGQTQFLLKLTNDKPTPCEINHVQ